MEIKLNRIDTDFNADTNRCWVQARTGVFPDGRALMTIQPLRLSGMDVFYGSSCLFSDDMGESWSKPVEQAGLCRRPWENGTEIIMSDATPAYHRQSGKMLLTGHSVVYDNDEIMAPPRPRHTTYSVFNDKERCWDEFKLLGLDEVSDIAFNNGSGSGQRVDLNDGAILLPIYHLLGRDAGSLRGNDYFSTIIRCSFDGSEMKYIEHGNSLSIPEPRGFCEPSLFRFGKRYFLTLRNTVKGYVSDSDDGLNFAIPKPWCFDDGQEIGNYNTQQHWLSLGDKLYLVYTRKGANNDHIFRHRAPLFVCQVDTDKLCLIRKTERVVVPERGARLGNFGCVQVSGDEAWITAAEWMQCGIGRPGVALCQKYGSDNSIFVAKLTQK